MTSGNDRSWKTCTEIITSSITVINTNLATPFPLSAGVTVIEDFLLTIIYLLRGKFVLRLLKVLSKFLLTLATSFFNFFLLLSRCSLSVWIIHRPWLTHFLNRKKFALRRKYLIRFRSAVLLIVNRRRYMRVCAQYFVSVSCERGNVWGHLQYLS